MTGAPETTEVKETRVEEDVVGVGRYVLSFILAGFIGLIVQYFLRKRGWTATWINIVLCIIIVVIVVTTGGE